MPTAALDKGDTAWVLICTAFVLLMTLPGLALFYGGMVRQRNVLATLLQDNSIQTSVVNAGVLKHPSSGYARGRTRRSRWQ